MSKKNRNRLIIVICLLLIAITALRQPWRAPRRTPEPANPALPPIEEPLPIGREAPPAPPMEVPPKPSPVPVPQQKITVAPKVSAPKPKRIPKPATVVPKIAVPIAPPVVAPPLPPIAPPPPPPMEWHGNDTSINHSGQIIVKTDEQWVRFWAEHHPDEAAPDVDFSRNMVVGVFIGARPADGFSVKIAKVEQKSDTLLVTSQELAPPPGTFAVNVTVYPYALKVIPRSSLRVKFNELR